MRRVEREEALEAEEGSWYGTVEAFPPYRMGHSPFTVEVLEDPLPHHFKPVSNVYDGGSHG